MRGPLKTTSRWCKGCGRQVAAVASSTGWGCGDLLLIPLTVGLWLPIRFALMAMTNPWRCQECGRRV